MPTHPMPVLGIRLRNVAIAALAMFVGACGGGSPMAGGPTMSGCSASQCGSAIVQLTDAAGDLLSYTVDLTSLQLQKADGTMVQTLPATTRVDIAQLVNLSEVISAGQVPAGDYVAATLGVDFSNASIMADDGTGAGVAVHPVDSSGQPLGQVQMTVQLDNRNHLRISGGRVSQIAFDFNLLASNTVDLTAHTVTVSPIIVANVVPPSDRDTRVRGPLASVDTAGSSYAVNVRSFHEMTHTAGQLIVHTDSNTSFEINGTVYAGSAGLAQLAMLTDMPITAAFGTLQTSDMSFHATRVLAGSSVESAVLDHLSGNVLARAGNVLTVGGVEMDRHDGGFAFEHGTVAVTVADTTKVTREGQSTGAAAIADISVGQRVEVFGSSSTDTSGNISLDASTGRVRLDFTQIAGTITATSSGGLTLSLLAIDGHAPSRFNFAGTGTSPAQDANPAQYAVATGALNVSLQPQSFTRLFGFVAPFGTAPADFNVVTYTDYSMTSAVLDLDWSRVGSTMPFLSTSTTSLVVDVGSPRLLWGEIGVAGPDIDVHTLASLNVAASAQGTLGLAIGHATSRRIDSFSSFADFSTALGSALNGTTVLRRLLAEGHFDAATGSFSATKVFAVVSD
jgi:hypothetical protein